MNVRALILGALLCLLVPRVGSAACGATERWFVKMGTDPAAALIHIDDIVPITVEGLNHLPFLQSAVPHGDNKFRLDAEKVVYQTHGRLVRFKNESDADYHLVITDDSLRYSPGGQNTAGQETGTSFIAEIPNPNCVAGTAGDPAVHSQFANQLQDVRAKFEARFPHGAGADTDLHGIPVTLVGVAFYDRPHFQTGRAVNGIELHPLLSIRFDDQVVTEAAAQTTETAAVQLLVNPDFEDGTTGWAGTVKDIGDFSEATHSGANFAWLGGLGQAHTESLYQKVSIPATDHAVTLELWLSIASNETMNATAYDKLFVQVRDSAGKIIKTLATYSNLDETDTYQKRSFDLSEFAGQDIQIYFRMVEDNGKATSFKIDDVTLTVP